MTSSAPRAITVHAVGRVAVEDSNTEGDVAEAGTEHTSGEEVIPHYIILAILFEVAVVVVVIAWFAIRFTGRQPRGLFNYVVGVGRWAL